MSDTPETDAYIGDQNEGLMTEGEFAMCEFARMIERDRNELRHKFETLERENAAMREQIEHLGKANSMLHLDLVDAHAETAKETRRADKAEVENAAMREAIKEAYKIIDVLYMDALDNHKESWPRARKWMEQWKEVAK